ncbi:MAG: ribose 5-phosphate isomerase A, partial [Candidatus Korarchaeota archaeon]
MVSHFETEKLAAAKAAARIIKDGDIVGIGSGSTITYFIREIGKKVATEGIDIVCVPTSIDTKLKLIECGLKIGDTDTHIPNIAFDGADQITKEGWMIKGGGAAMTRERIVAHLSERWIILVDSSKIVEKLCRAVPIEFLYFG